MYLNLILSNIGLIESSYKVNKTIISRFLLALTASALKHW